MSNVNKWANFLKNEKLDPAKLADTDVVKLVALATALAADGPPKINNHANTLESRRKVCRKAFDLSIDLLAMKVRKFQGRGSKPAIGRGLLDIWNQEYGKRFGGTLGTAGAAEVTRRGIVTKLSEQRGQEQRAELRGLIAEGKHTAQQLAERFKLPLAYVENQMSCYFNMACIANYVPTPPDVYAKAIRALQRNGTTLEYIAERTGRSVEWLKKILEENPCQTNPSSTPTTASSPDGHEKQTS